MCFLMMHSGSSPQFLPTGVICYQIFFVTSQLTWSTEKNFWDSSSMDQLRKREMWKERKWRLRETGRIFRNKIVGERYWLFTVLEGQRHLGMENMWTTKQSLPLKMQNKCGFLPLLKCRISVDISAFWLLWEWCFLILEFGFLPLDFLPLQAVRSVCSFESDCVTSHELQLQVLFPFDR